MEFSQEEFDEILSIFSEESDDIVHRLNNNILALEKNPDNKDIIIELFRDAHSLKGAARMIGFNDIQSIAHKIEDILGLAKENKIVINSDITDTIYKSIDFINMSIQMSVKAKKEVKLNDYGKFLEALEQIAKNSQPSPGIKDVSSPDSDVIIHDKAFLENLKSHYDDINAKLAEIVYLFLKMDKKADLNFIMALIYDIDEVAGLFGGCNDKNLKDDIADIIFKLEFVSKNTGILNNTEITELRAKFDKIIHSITLLLEQAGLEVFDYKELAQKKLQGDSEPEQDDKSVDFVAFDAAEFIDGILKLEISPEGVNQIIKKSEQLISDYEDTPVEIIFRKIKEILEVIKGQNIRPDAEILTILKQSIQLVEKLINDSQKADKEDIDLLLQSLDITEQMVRFKKKPEVPDLPAATNVNEIKTKPSAKNVPSDVFHFFESTAIKTLRVDTHKLDKLVNQIGEVIISKIKTQKHVMELENINNKLMDLYESTMKAYNYLKYYDRKLAQVDKDGDINVFINFNKQFLSYFNENQNRLNEEIYEIYNLHKHMQEDDAKLNLVVNKLEQMVKDIRLLPLATVFHMIPRMVRDIAKEKGKEIELSISGSETHADKKIIEEIKTPLIHIIRNAIDHGIEPPEEREALGKDPAGKILLNSRHSENKIIIEVVDDGRGVNLDKIRQKAIAQGLLTFDEINSMSDEQIMNLIFWPGFTTEDVVTDISGRGIGLDIVQTKISQLNGKVKVRSVISQGTSVVIELPVTMATIKSFIIRLRSQFFAIPVSAIKSVIKITDDEIFKKDGKNTILYQQTSVPVFDMAHALGFEPVVKDSDKKTILLIEAENNIVGFIVDELIGDQEILNKELAPPLFKLKNISGITTLVNGEICLIVNVSELLKTIMSVDYKAFAVKKPAPVLQPLEFNPSEHTILVVDDFMTTRTMLKNILASKGYEVVVANDGAEAINILGHKSCDLVITDIEMPNMNGFELIENIKQNELYAKIPLMLISSIVNDENKANAKNLGVEIFIDKNDFNHNYFIRSVEYLIIKHKNEEKD